MDSFSLRQEISELTKQWNNLKHQLVIGEARIKELHEEEMRYLKEIPIFKNQSKEAKLQAQQAINDTVPLEKKFEFASSELSRIEGLIAVENSALMSLKETENKIIEETRIMNEQIKQRHVQAKQRELAVGDREKVCELREVGHRNRDLEQDKREVKLNARDSKQKENEAALCTRIEAHELNVNNHNDKVYAFLETKELHLQDERLLSLKQQKADKLVDENIKLKASLLMQAEKLDKEIKLAQNKQSSLDRSLADLKNQENALKVKELRVGKLIKDAGIQKELQDLEAQLK